MAILDFGLPTDFALQMLPRSKRPPAPQPHPLDAAAPKNTLHQRALLIDMQNIPVVNRNGRTRVAGANTELPAPNTLGDKKTLLKTALSKPATQAVTDHAMPATPPMHHPDLPKYEAPDKYSYKPPAAARYFLWLVGFTQGQYAYQQDCHSDFR